MEAVANSMGRSDEGEEILADNNDGDIFFQQRDPDGASNGNFRS